MLEFIEILEIARHQIVKAAKGCGISLRQTFVKEGKTLRFKAGGGHTLKAQLAQSNALIQTAGTSIKQAFVDLAYRGVDADNSGVEVIHRGRIKSMSKAERKQLKRRQAIEPAIGHTKHDNRMIRCHLNGSIGDALHAICCAAGYNIRWLMRAIQRLGLKGLFALAFIVSTLSMAGQIRAMRAR